MEQRQHFQIQEPCSFFLNKEISLCHLTLENKIALQTQLICRAALGNILCLTPKYKEPKLWFTSHLSWAASGILVNSMGDPGCTWPAACRRACWEAASWGGVGSFRAQGCWEHQCRRGLSQEARGRSPWWGRLGGKDFLPRGLKNSRVGAFLISKEAEICCREITYFWHLGFWVWTHMGPSQSPPTFK